MPRKRDRRSSRPPPERPEAPPQAAPERRHAPVPEELPQEGDEPRRDGPEYIIVGDEPP